MLTSILDNDLYKFTMQHASLYCPRSVVKYEFINRGKTEFRDGFAKDLREAIDEMRGLRLTREELYFLREKCLYFPEQYLWDLKDYRYDPSEVKVTQEDGNLHLTIEGTWYQSILWEVPLMAMISELHFAPYHHEIMSGLGTCNAPVIMSAFDKGKLFSDSRVNFVDFGTRRRFSYENHDKVVAELIPGAFGYFNGTSNIHLAMKHGIKPLGTQAHEWIQFHSAQYGFRNANLEAMKKWELIYGNYLAIALTDTFGSEDFFRVFDKEQASKLDGVRQDSGSPFEFLERTIKHYEELGLDPKRYTIVFSDSLNPKKVLDIHEVVDGRIQDVYGIGTNLTNDVGVKPLNMVIKMVQANGVDVCKLSDDVGKHTGKEEVIARCKEELYLPHTAGTVVF